jgi:hypothetical protein
MAILFRVLSVLSLCAMGLVSVLLLVALARLLCIFRSLPQELGEGIGSLFPI